MILVILYLFLLLVYHASIYCTNFVRPKGLWNLVIFRVGGWKGQDGYIHQAKWVGSRIDFQKYYRDKYKESI